MRRQLQGQRQLVQALETSGWRDALLGFFTGVAGPAAERVRADIFAAPRFYAAQLMRDIVASGTAGDDAEELGRGAMPPDVRPQPDPDRPGKTPRTDSPTPSSRKSWALATTRC